MSNNYKSSDKKNIIDIYFSHLPKVAFVSSVFSVVFIWCYLRNISRLDIFMRIEMSAYVLASIFIFFLVVASYVILPVLYSDEFIFSKLKKDFRLRMKFILALIQVAMMLPILFFSENEE